MLVLACLPNNSELPLTCTEKKTFYGYHSALQTADDNPPERLWDKILGMTGKPLFSRVYVRPVSKRDSDIQWRILHGALAFKVF